MSAAPVLLKLLKISMDVSLGPNQGEKYTFEKPSITIGRGPENDLVFAQDVKVSRQHLQLIVTHDQVWVKNLSARNVLAVDGEICTEKSLRPGAILRFGDTELKINFDQVGGPIQAAPPLGAELALVGKKVPGAPMAGLPMNPPAGGLAHPPPPPIRPAPAYRPSASSGGSSRVKFYVIIGVVAVIGYFLMQDQIKKRNQIKLRDSVSTELSINQSQSEFDKVSKDIETKGQDTIQYRLAQEQYLRGFRDYRQGQYIRSLEEFQAALSFYPNHELARKYYTLSKRKFDEQIQFNMIQGKRYYGVENFRLCMGYYSTVIKMKKDERDPLRREALQYYNECEIKLRGKY